MYEYGISVRLARAKAVAAPLANAVTTAAVPLATNVVTIIVSPFSASDSCLSLPAPFPQPFRRRSCV